jgi:hypothetical protein
LPPVLLVISSSASPSSFQVNATMSTLISQISRLDYHGIAKVAHSFPHSPPSLRASFSDLDLAADSARRLPCPLQSARCCFSWMDAWSYQVVYPFTFLRDRAPSLCPQNPKGKWRRLSKGSICLLTAYGSGLFVRNEKGSPWPPGAPPFFPWYSRWPKVLGGVTSGPVQPSESMWPDPEYSIDQLQSD